MGYVAHYIGSDTLPKTELIDYLKSNAEEDFLARWRLSGTSKNVKKTRNCSQLMAAYKVDSVPTYFVDTILWRVTISSPCHIDCCKIVGF